MTTLGNPQTGLKLHSIDISHEAGSLRARLNLQKKLG
jgi:hypothetical protein